MSNTPVSIQPAQLKRRTGTSGCFRQPSRSVALACTPGRCDATRIVPRSTLSDAPRFALPMHGLPQGRCSTNPTRLDRIDFKGVENRTYRICPARSGRASAIMRRDVDCNVADAFTTPGRPQVFVLSAHSESGAERMALPPRHLVGMRRCQCALGRRGLDSTYLPWRGFTRR